MMRGSAVPTIVWSIAASSAASSRPVSVPISCGRVRRTSPDVTYTGSEAAAVDMRMTFCSVPGEFADRRSHGGSAVARK